MHNILSILNIIQLKQKKPQNKHVLFLAITPSQLPYTMKCQACLKRQKKKRNIRYGQKKMKRNRQIGEYSLGLKHFLYDMSLIKTIRSSKGCS